jgi:hypothetical protein
MHQSQQIKEILNSLSVKTRFISTDQSIAKIVKDIDKAVNEAYINLYNVTEGRKKVPDQQDKKHGHCC